MTLSITFSQKMLAGIFLFALLIVLLVSGIRWVSAQGGGTPLNVCIKDDKITVITDSNICDKEKEMAVSLVTGEGLQALEAENAALKALVRRLHRNSAAVIDIDRGGSTSPGVFTELKYRLRVCPEEDVEDGFCTANDEVLEWTLTEADDDLTLTKSSGDGDFDALVNHLTDGNNDFICRETELGGTGISCSPERTYFRDFAGPISSDLAGYNIDQISLVVDFIQILHPSAGGTQYDLRGRLFYELAD